MYLLFCDRFRFMFQICVLIFQYSWQFYLMMVWLWVEVSVFFQYIVFPTVPSSFLIINISILNVIFVLQILFCGEFDWENSEKSSAFLCHIGVLPKYRPHILAIMRFLSVFVSTIFSRFPTDMFAIAGLIARTINDPQLVCIFLHCKWNVCFWDSDVLDQYCVWKRSVYCFMCGHICGECLVEAH